MAEKRTRGIPNVSRRELASGSVMGSSGFIQTLIIARMGTEAFEVLRRMTFLLLGTVAFIYLAAMAFCLGYGYGDSNATEATKTAGWVMLAFALVTLLFTFLTPYVFMPAQRQFARKALGIQNTPGLSPR